MRLLTLALLLVPLSVAVAQPRENTSMELPRLAIDDCPTTDPTKTPDQLTDMGSERYGRGETLYLQGDYDGAVTEFIDAYCLNPSYFTILKDIGQAFERSLEYEQAIGYLQRYVDNLPPDKVADKNNVGRRITVLKNLRAQVFVETAPRDGAQITIRSATGIEELGVSGKPLGVFGGKYKMTVHLDGYETVEKDIVIKIGKPYTYFVPLEKLQGDVSVQVTPNDARLFLDNRFIGFGHYEDKLPAGTYKLQSEAQGYINDTRDIVILPNQLHREQFEMHTVREVGRRQAILASGVAGAAISFALLNAFKNTGIAGAGAAIGGAGSVGATYLLLPPDFALGTSSVSISSTAAGAITGIAIASAFTNKDNIITPIGGIGAVVGAATGYVAGDKSHISPGDAALVNTGMVWGTAAGGLFAVSFAPKDNAIVSGLVLSGLGMGVIGGALVSHYFTVSRTHAALIDVGGIVGVLGGLALESIAYPTQQGGSSALTDQAEQRLANYALGGMAIGLITAGVLTRNLDDPKVPLSPSIGQVIGADGRAIPTYGLSARW